MSVTCLSAENTCSLIRLRASPLPSRLYPQSVGSRCRHGATFCHSRHGKGPGGKPRRRVWRNVATSGGSIPVVFVRERDASVWCGDRELALPPAGSADLRTARGFTYWRISQARYTIRRLFVGRICGASLTSPFATSKGSTWRRGCLFFTRTRRRRASSNSRTGSAGSLPARVSSKVSILAARTDRPRG